jgi:hypothetical protein
VCVDNLKLKTQVWKCGLNRFGFFSDRWHRHLVHRDARKSRREKSDQGSGTVALQTQSHLLAGPGRQSHVELQETCLVSGEAKTTRFTFVEITCNETYIAVFF